MTIKITDQELTNVSEYAGIPIAFTVSSVFDVTEDREISGKFLLNERHLSRSYMKDYDAIEGERPTNWAKRFDVSSWRMFSAHIDDRHVGGAVVAVKTRDLTMLAGRDDLAVIWDIRVSPSVRGRGIGTALFHSAESWAGTKNFHHLKVETQNINVAACQFYAAQGFELIEANRHAYPGLPDEVQLIWQKVLPRGTGDKGNLKNVGDTPIQNP